MKKKYIFVVQMFEKNWIGFLVIGFVLCNLSYGRNVRPGRLGQNYVPGLNNDGSMSGHAHTPHEEGLHRQRKDNEFKEQTTLSVNGSEEGGIRMLPDLRNDSIPIHDGDSVNGENLNEGPGGQPHQELQRNTNTPQTLHPLTSHTEREHTRHSQPGLHLGAITDANPLNTPAIHQLRSTSPVVTEHPVNSPFRTSTVPISDRPNSENIQGFGVESIHGGKIDHTESVINLPEVTDSLPLDPGHENEEVVSETMQGENVNQKVEQFPTEAVTFLNEITSVNHMYQTEGTRSEIDEHSIGQEPDSGGEPNVAGYTTKPEQVTEPPTEQRVTEEIKVNPKFRTEPGILPTENVPENVNTDSNTLEPGVEPVHNVTVTDTSNSQSNTSGEMHQGTGGDNAGETDMNKHGSKEPSGEDRQSTTKRRNFFPVSPTPHRKITNNENETTTTATLSSVSESVYSYNIEPSSTVTVPSYASHMTPSQTSTSSAENIRPSIESFHSSLNLGQSSELSVESVSTFLTTPSLETLESSIYRHTNIVQLASSYETYQTVSSQNVYETSIAGNTELLTSTSFPISGLSNVQPSSFGTHGVNINTGEILHTTVTETLVPTKTLALELSSTKSYVVSSESMVENPFSEHISPSVAHLVLSSDEIVLHNRSQTKITTRQASSPRHKTSETSIPTSTPNPTATSPDLVMMNASTSYGKNRSTTNWTSTTMSYKTKSASINVRTKKPQNLTPKQEKPDVTGSPSPGTTSLQPSQIPTEFLQISLTMTLSDFCSKKKAFITELVEVIDSHDGKIIEEKQIVLMNVHPLQCEELGKPFGKGEDNNEVTETKLDIYIKDLEGNVDIELTKSCVTIIEPGFQKSGSQFTVTNVKLVPKSHYNGNNHQKDLTAKKSTKMEPGITIAIVIASVGGACCVALLILQIIIHRRSGKRMKPYFPGTNRYSIRSLDSMIALGVVPKSRPNSGFWNPGLEQEEPLQKTEPTNHLSYRGLSNFVRDLSSVHAEFETLPQITPRLSCVPVGAEDKNRFANVLPHPHTRVKLKEISGEENSTYINANYITGYKCDHKAYIATQDPLKNTVNDFWRMVWEQQSRVILMLTPMDEHGQPRCTPYWPDSENCRKQYGDYTVMLKKKDVGQEYTVAVFEIKDIENNLIRDIRHFWYTCWSIDGTPEPLSFVKFILDTRPHYEDSGAPLTVHCSPGTGRTGTLIALDICMRSFESTRSVDVANVVHRMRQERAGAVQTKDQYQLVYRAVNEYATVMSSPSVSHNSSVTTLHNML